jgi:alpha-galactosidase
MLDTGGQHSVSRITHHASRITLSEEEIMKENIKIVLIGAGSKEFSRGLIHDLVLDNELSQAAQIDVVLVDINTKSLQTMLGYARRCVEVTGSPIKFSATENREEALPGADFVLLSVAIGRMDLWEQDFRVPLSFGMRHIYGENGGPGAVFHALRNYHLIFPILHDIERLCPEAYLINFTNPEARILTAILTLTKIKAIGLCHGFYDFHHLVSRVLERPVEDLDIRTAGMNHFYTYYHISEKHSGKDLIPAFEQKLSETPDMLAPLVRFLWETFGMIGYGSDQHIGEYIGYAHEFTGASWEFGIENRKVLQTDDPVTSWTAFEAWRRNMDVGALLASDILQVDDEYLHGQRMPDTEVLVRSGELAVPVIGDIVLNREILRAAVNVLNTEGYIDNLSREGCIEVPAIVDAEGVHPEFIGSLPEGFAAQIRLQHAIQKLLVEAYQQKSKKLLLQALLLDPVVDSAVNAQKFLEYMLNIQVDYLPEFS